VVDSLLDNFDNVSPEKFLAFGVAGLAVLILITIVIFKFTRRLKGDHFIKNWKSLQQKLPDKQSWRDAVVEADNLLDDALRKKKIKGKTMGERLVNAQKIFSDNDGVWYGHKLRKKIDNIPEYTPKKQEVKKALLGLRVGLKDIGAM
jgi:hypothetical protein